MQTKQNEKVINKIETSFRKQVQQDKNVKGAFLLVHSESKDIHLNIAEGLMDAYVIGTFNDFAYEKKGVKFMLMKVINALSKLK